MRHPGRLTPGAGGDGRITPNDEAQLLRVREGGLGVSQIRSGRIAPNDEAQLPRVREGRGGCQGELPLIKLSCQGGGKGGWGLGHRGYPPGRAGRVGGMRSTGGYDSEQKWRAHVCWLSLTLSCGDEPRPSPLSLRPLLLDIFDHVLYGVFMRA
jgi:hypothetical protein